VTEPLRRRTARSTRSVFQRLPLPGRRIQQVAHELPPDSRIAVEEPVEESVFVDVMF
jgi:hypothetical protein